MYKIDLTRYLSLIVEESRRKRNPKFTALFNGKTLMVRPACDCPDSTCMFQFIADATAEATKLEIFEESFFAHAENLN